MKIIHLLFPLALVSCGDATVANGGSDAASDAPNTLDSSEVSIHLNVCFIAPRDDGRVERVRLVWVSEDGRMVERTFMPTELIRSEGGEYHPVCTQLDVSSELTLNIGWTVHYSEEHPDDTASQSLFRILPGGTFRFAGQVTVMDQRGQRWLAYPTVIERGNFDGYLRFVPEQSCRSNYPRRHDDICLQ